MSKSKGFFKKPLAMIMSFILVMSFMPVNVFATGVDNAPTVSLAMGVPSSANSASLNISITKGVSTQIIQSVTLKYYLEGSTAEVGTRTETTSNTSITFDVTNLDASKNYYCHIVVGFKESSSGAAKTVERGPYFFTASSPSTATFTNFSVTSNNTATPTVSCTFTAPSATEYGFVFVANGSGLTTPPSSRNDSRYTYQAIGTTFSSGAYRSVSILSANTVSGTTYRVWPYIVSGGVFSTGSTAQTFTVASNTIYLYNPTADTATNSSFVQLIATHTGSSSGDVFEYGFYYSTVPTQISSSNMFNGNYTQVYVGGSSGFTSPFYGQISNSNLTTGTTYYFWSYVRTSSGGYQFSATSSFVAVGSGATVTTTNAYSNVDNTIHATGTVTPNNSTVTEYGFVYSTSSSTPTLSNATRHVVSYNSTNSYTSFSSDITISSTSSSTVRYYVRAYAVVGYNENNVSYGTTQYVDITPSTVSVTLSSVTETGGSTASAIIRLSYTSQSSVTEWGVVYSTSQSSPTRSTSNTSYKALTSGLTTSNITVEMTGLQANTRYYVRGYARQSNGTYVYSTNVRQVTTSEDIKPTVSNVTGITHNSASVSGSVDSSAKISERGFVYSRTNSLPTISDASVKSTTSSTGSYSLTLEFLAANTTYYVRSYVKSTSGEYYYSADARTFRTLDNVATLVITYRTSDGAEVGTQTINSAVGNILTQNSLILPANYRLQAGSWLFTVFNTTDNITIYVESTGTGTATAPTPTPTATSAPTQPTQPTQSAEGAYMTGAGGYNFSPDRPATVIEVAAMVYSLLADPNVTYYGRYFPDMPSNPLTQNIVNFVSSMGYMIGDDNGMFRPDDNITRAEIATILCEIKNYAEYYYGDFPIPSAFADTTGHWAQGFIALSYINRAFGGYEDGTFRPNNNVTRAELAVIFSNVFDRSGQPLGNIDFVDVPRDHWAYKYIMNAAVPMP